MKSWSRASRWHCGSGGGVESRRRMQAVKRAGLLEKVRGAVQEKDRVVLTFDDGTSVSTDNENEWSHRLRKLGYGKN